MGFSMIGEDVALESKIVDILGKGALNLSEIASILRTTDKSVDTEELLIDVNTMVANGRICVRFRDREDGSEYKSPFDILTRKPNADIYEEE